MLALANLLRRQQGAGEIQGYGVTHGCEAQGAIVAFARLTRQRMGEDPSQPFVGPLFRPVILTTENIGFGGLEEGPGGPKPRIDAMGGIEPIDPRRIGVVIMGARNEIARVGVIPESLPPMAAHEDRRPVFHRHRKDP